ncbi:MAG: nucleotide exchange factor GrpE [Bacillota bacterium]
MTEETTREFTNDELPGDEVEQLRKALAEAEAKAAENWDLFLRCRADLDNYRKRVERDLERRVRMGREDLLLSLLEIMDNFGRALEAQDSDGLRSGVEMIFRQLEKLLGTQGVEPIASVGQPFDPAVHEAVAVWDSPDHTEETVTDEIRRGYRIHDDVLRASRVRVARPAGPTT